ncbi:MAG TPA: FAD-dependent oxidoreductase [Myxococcaceae bacterium]|nr:FAD-dependent oxidoreductase [Myxococcaceae bacterium]
MSRTRVTVIGGGVSGLTCGVVLQEAGFQVRIVARERWPRTVSAVAAAMWYPYKAWPIDRVLAWSKRSYEVFAQLCQDSVGVYMRECTERFRADRPEPWWRPAVDRFAADPRAWRFSAPVADMSVYLPYLERRFERAGGHIETGTVERLDVAALVINCTGLAARELASDPELVPVLGQVVYVRNPGLSVAVVEEDHPDGMAYVIPRKDDAVLGGTAEEGRFDASVREEVGQAIVRRCTDLEPKLRGAEVLRMSAGLRPVRSSVRVERQQLGRSIVVHDYGHGGAGMTLSWGCAEEVLRLVREA